jgi:hypothetical protein
MENGLFSMSLVLWRQRAACATLGEFIAAGVNRSADFAPAGE